VQVSLMLANYVVGLVLDEEANPAGAAEARGGGGQEVLVEGLAWPRALPPDRYPSLVRCAAAVGDPAAFGAEGRFAFGLAALLAGLEQRLHVDSPGRTDG
jgi:hypothetical protein